MVSAERVMAYGRLESEASLETHPPITRPPSYWPSQGHIQINDLSYHHSSEGPLVLKGITCTIKSGEKVWYTQYKLDLILSCVGWYCRTYWCW